MLEPGKAIYDFPGLTGGFLRDGQWLSQDSDVTQFLRHDMQIALTVIKP